MAYIWRGYGLVAVLGLLFAALWLLQAIVQVGIEGARWSAFFAATLGNWQATYLHLFSFMLIATWLCHSKGWPPKDGVQRMEEKLDALKAHVADLERRLETPL